MKAVWGGRLYDTETAELVGEEERPIGDRDGYLGQCHEKHYRTSRGKYFSEIRYKFRGFLWGHRDWTEPYLCPMSKSHAVGLKVDGKIQDKKLKVVNG